MTDEITQDVVTLGGQMTVSEQLLKDRLVPPLFLLSEWGFFESTPEQRQRAAERRAEREAEWDTKAECGLIGISDNSDYGCGPTWQLAERGNWVQEWVTLPAWTRYTEALRALREAEEALES